MEHHRRWVERDLDRSDSIKERAAYLSDYNNVLRDFPDGKFDDWGLARATLLHIFLASQYSDALSDEILRRFREEALGRLQGILYITRLIRPQPQPNPALGRPIYQLTPRDATVYYSSLALARLVCEDNPNQVIELLETIKGFFDPFGVYHLPEDKHRLDSPNELQLLPNLYERVERFEDSLKLTTPFFGFPSGRPEESDAAIRRLNGWLDELLRSGGIGEVQRFLDQIYKWLQQANEIDNEDREDISGCSNNTRQYWAWYYGYALGLLIKSRPHFRASLLDQVDAGEWESGWHVAGVLFEPTPEAWDNYREKALDFYHASDIEYRSGGLTSGNLPQPPHMSAQSDLYWAIRVGFADAHLGNTDQHHSSPDHIGDALERIETITSSTARHVLRAEQTLESLNDTLGNRLPPDNEHCKEKLKGELHQVWDALPKTTVDHLVEASQHQSTNHPDACRISLSKAVESLFTGLIKPRIQAHPDAKQLKLFVPWRKQKKQQKGYSLPELHNVPISGWAYIIRTTTAEGNNALLRTILIEQFPSIGIDSFVSLHQQLNRVNQLRGEAAHHSDAPGEVKDENAQELWNIVVGNDGNGGFLTKFYSALGIIPEA